MSSSSSLWKTTSSVFLQRMAGRNSGQLKLCDAARPLNTRWVMIVVNRRHLLLPTWNISKHRMFPWAKLMDKLSNALFTQSFTYASTCSTDIQKRIVVYVCRYHNIKMWFSKDIWMIRLLYKQQAHGVDTQVHWHFVSLCERFLDPNRSIVWKNVSIKSSEVTDIVEYFQFLRKKEIWRQHIYDA